MDQKIKPQVTKIEISDLTQAVIYFNSREPVTVTCDKGGVCALLSDYLRPIQERSDAPELKSSYDVFQRVLRSEEHTVEVALSELQDTEIIQVLPAGTAQVVENTEHNLESRS